MGLFDFLKGNPETELQHKRKANPEAETKSNRQVTNECAQDLGFEQEVYKAKEAVINSKHLTKTQKDKLLNSHLKPKEIKQKVKEAKDKAKQKQENSK